MSKSKKTYTDLQRDIAKLIEQADALKGQKLDVILTALSRQVEKYNSLNPGYEVHYVCGRAVSGEDGVFEIRELLRLAMQRMHS